MRQLALTLCLALTACTEAPPEPTYRETRQAQWLEVREQVVTDAREMINAERYFEAAALIAPWRDVADGEARGLHNAAAKLHASIPKKPSGVPTQQAEPAEPIRSAWSGTYAEVERYLHVRAHDPNSVEVETCTQAARREDGWGTRCTWRARNGFGALRTEHTLFLINGDNVTTLD